MIAGSFHSPRLRRLAVARGAVPSARTTRSFFQRPPFAAVAAFLRSRGYKMPNHRQQSKWLTHKLGDWVPFQVTKEDKQLTRWVRSAPGEKLAYSDGSEIPNEQKLRYALAKRTLEVA